METLECNLCDNEDECFLLPCSIKLKNSVLSYERESFEENILNHVYLTHICRNCISICRDTCPFCSYRFIVNYKLTNTRKYIISFTVLLYIISLFLSISLSYTGILISFENSSLLNKIGYILDITLNLIISLLFMKCSFSNNLSLFYMNLLSFSNTLYISLLLINTIIFNSYEKGFSIQSMEMYSHIILNLVIYFLYHKKIFIINTICCQSPININSIFSIE